MSNSQTPPATEALQESLLADFEDYSQQPEFVRKLDAVSRATRPTRFPGAHEQRFQSDARGAFGRIRALLCLIPMALLGSSPLWGERLLPHQSELLPLLYLGIFGLIMPCYLAAAWMQWRRPARLASEIVFILAFLVMAVALELFRQRAALEGFLLPSSLAGCALISFIIIGRMPLQDSAVFVLLYLAFIAACDAIAPEQTAAARSGMDWIVEGFFIGVMLMGSVSNEIYIRRTWAAQQLLKSLAYVDPLTGLPNRRAFEQRYELVNRHARREHKRVFFALIDMDFFKNLNDQYGHDYGDGVLVETGVVLAVFARRPLDIAARLGGEEFALLLYDCEEADGRARLEELRQQIESLRLANAGVGQGWVTTSAGGLLLPPDMPLAEAYRRADTALYEAKRQGRNRVVITNPAAALDWPQAVGPVSVSA